jgi:class 3 adenylate cyclase
MLLITGVIKKATKTVKRIADGDLSARINYKSNDELGEICNEVNDMAINLEKSFEEKDRTEKFYYKFVPEKFREYLGKENFTDLSLGDASSRELTVLFCDIRSFSINSEIMTAKENFAFVNTIYGKAGPIIREHNGFVDKYIGDAVMALFEKPDDAVKCGADLYRAIVLDPETAKELKVSDINIGIGIHTGMAMIGIVGESERLSGTVISDTVNLSSRLESLTKQYKTAMLVSKDTVDRLASPEDLNLRYLGMIQVAGVNEVKGVYEVLDCLKDEDKTVRSDNSIEFREAMRLFQLGRREDAVIELEKLVSENRADHVVEMYLNYIKSLSPDDKGNIFRFVRK